MHTMHTHAQPTHTHRVPLFHLCSNLIAWDKRRSGVSIHTANLKSGLANDYVPLMFQDHLDDLELRIITV